MELRVSMDMINSQDAGKFDTAMRLSGCIDESFLEMVHSGQIARPSKGDRERLLRPVLLSLSHLYWIWWCYCIANQQCCAM